MTVVSLSTIVEGHGEVEAVPLLVRKICASRRPELSVLLPHPIRIPRLSIVRSGELERAVDLAARRSSPGGGVLVLLDAESGCPALLGPTLLARAVRSRPDVPVGVVLAKCEFESWFLAGAESLSGRRDLAHDLTPPADSEEVQGAKEWLTARMPEGRTYRETRDQAALTAALDVDLALPRAPSLQKLDRELDRLLNQIAEGFGE